MKYIKLYEVFNSNLFNENFTYFSKLERMNLVIFKYNKYKNLMFSIKDNNLLKMQGLNHSTIIDNNSDLEESVNKLISDSKSYLLSRDKIFKETFPLTYKLFKEFNNVYDDYFIYYLNSNGSDYKSVFYPTNMSKPITTYYTGYDFPIYYSDSTNNFKFKTVKLFFNKNEILVIDDKIFHLNNMSKEKLHNLIKTEIK